MYHDFVCQVLAFFGQPPMWYGRGTQLNVDRELLLQLSNHIMNCITQVEYLLNIILIDNLT